MQLLSLYRTQIETLGYALSPDQLAIVSSLDDLLNQIKQERSQAKTWVRFVNKISLSRKSRIKGRYIWGGVGRGKSWLMDLFYQCLTGKKKIRLHYHQFMQQIHMALISEKGHENPLNLIAKRFAQQWQVICLDEFAVADITDAMLLHGLLQALKEQGVILIMTSNVPPGELYSNGLQRDRFLPAIELIEEETVVLKLPGDEDYRLSTNTEIDAYYCPAGEEAQHKMHELFQQMVGPIIQCSKSLLVNRRCIQAHCVSGKAAWFEFEALCSGPRSANDYIEIASQFNTLFISSVPALDENIEDKAYRFVQLIDELYDRRINLVMSAERPPQLLYSGKQLCFEFVRTASRLQEMRWRSSPLS